MCCCGGGDLARAALERQRRIELVRTIVDPSFQRFAGRPPAEAAANDALYPFDRIHATAERAAGFDPELLVFLWSRLSDPDAAVRYWALKGLQLRSVTLAETEREQLHACLADESPSVRIAAAEVLARQTDPADRSAAWALLVAQADPTRDGMVPATAALEAMSNLRAPNTAIRAQLAALPREGPSPDARYNSYLGRLIETILAAHPAN